MFGTEFLLKMLDIYVTRSNSTLCMANLNCAIYISLEWRLKLLGEGKLLEANHFSESKWGKWFMLFTSISFFENAILRNFCLF